MRGVERAAAAADDDDDDGGDDSECNNDDSGGDVGVKVAEDVAQVSVIVMRALLLPPFLHSSHSRRCCSCVRRCDTVSANVCVRGSLVCEMRS